MDEVSLNTEPVGDEEGNEFEIEGDCAMAEYVGQSGLIQGENPLPPAVGMEFESYEDVYYFYNCYAKEQGFGVRVSNTWYRKSRERYRGKLSCSSAGFKKRTEANRPRPETRTGCPAMVKFRLMENRRWRIIEVELEHNHLISPTSGKFYKSHKQLGAGGKRALQLDSAEETQKIRLFRTLIIDVNGNSSFHGQEGKSRNDADLSSCLKLREGDVQTVQDFFCRSQLTDPNFFYVVDLNEKGSLRNLFWIDSRSRAAYDYFGDVVAINTSCLKNKYDVPLVSFNGVNHHFQPVLLGCGVLAGETLESYTWLLRAWLTCFLGRPPQAIVIDRRENLQIAVADVFPRSSHCFCLSDIMQDVTQKLGDLFEYEAIEEALRRAVNYSQKQEEFEAAWEEMIQRNRLQDHQWLQTLYEDRRRWVPAYQKETFLAGMFPILPGNPLPSFFGEYLDEHTTLKEFLDKYDQALQSHHQLEALADEESRSLTLIGKPRCYFELQLSKLYTSEIFRRFQRELEGIYTCFTSRQLTVDGQIITYIVKEQVEIAGNQQETRDYEVSFNASQVEIICSCGLFNFKGYFCRHALSVLRQNGVEEIPPHYILPRWRKDIRRSYVLNPSCSGIDINNRIHRHDVVYKRILQVIEEGRKSPECYKIALQALDGILNKLHLAENPPKY